jgi:hypothetical protein
MGGDPPIHRGPTPRSFGSLAFLTSGGRLGRSPGVGHLALSGRDVPRTDRRVGPSWLLPFQPNLMTPAQLAAVSYLARYSGPTHNLNAYQLRRWFEWWATNGLDPLVGIQRAHVELYIRAP